MRSCQHHGAFIALLPISQSVRSDVAYILASSVHCAKQITNLFIAPLPTAVCRGSQRDVVYLGWPIGPLYLYEPKCEGRGGGRGVSANEYS